ncbi:hypothetical protein GCN74_26235 [Janthinobacterium sp. FT14W]|uniref:hypothetical protein n=1 Tax=Janthinobacterium sp. FT14W TaxID=2654253 RepID=UPI001265A9AE|nr:hypothetical protein [Janthinobacterium sp. FT14W]KAB8051903.1 hypothetical protein GCN74_26235 [Janthinobacterium sp. FT14W]
MKQPRVERPNYFSGEALLTDDFRCEQQYQMDMLAARNVSLYLYGIAHGLEVAASADGQPSQLEVSRGMAIDALGRQIILLEPAVLALEGMDPGATYFITINYFEVYADLSDESGTAGYKRIVQQPQIRYLRNLDQPGVNILLAVISLTTEGSINSLTYKSGRNERRYVGTSVGSVNFVTEGAGVNQAVSAPSNALGAQVPADYASISARREGSRADDYYLEFDAPRGQFMGLLTARNNLGVGTDYPVANLQIDAVTFKGKGTISWDNQLVTFSDAPAPFLQVGDQLIADPSVRIGKAQCRKVTKIVQDGVQVQIDAAFSPTTMPAPGSGYTYMRSALARFSRSDSSLLQVNLDGSVGLGLQALAKGGGASPGPNALVIGPDRNVGIGLNDGVPRAALDVQGQILADSLTASGAIKAQSFEGNGSKLQGMAMLSYWTKESPGQAASRLFYDGGNVGIFDRSPAASLSVGGGSAFIGYGVISSISADVVQGYNTLFLDQVKAGDQIAIGTLNQQQAVVAKTPVSDTELVLTTQFEIPVINSPYSYMVSGTDAPVTGTGKVSSNGTTITGTDGTKFTALSAGDTLMIPRFSPAAEQVQSVAQVLSDTQLTLSAPYVGKVVGLPYQLQGADGVRTAGAGAITIDPATPTVVTGSGTVFKSAAKAGDQLFAVPDPETLPRLLRVKSVDSHTQLTLQVPGSAAMPPFAAATSAYMVSTGLLAQFKANDDNAILAPAEEAGLPPAMLIVSNSEPPNYNTVAINLALADVDPQYALQVNGPVSFASGAATFSDLTAKTVWAQESVAIGGTGFATGASLLSVAAVGGAAPTLAVASGEVAVTGGFNVTGDVKIAGNVTATGTLQAGTLAGDMLGERAQYHNPSFPFKQLAASDGILMAFMGTLTLDSPPPAFFGVLQGATVDASGQPTSATYVTAFTKPVTVQTGKKSATTYNVPVPGVFTLPVRQGETWTVTLVTNTDAGETPPDIVLTWVPAGAGAGGLGAVMAGPDINPNRLMADSFLNLQERMASGQVPGTVAATAQEVIDGRVNDLTRIFGDATHMSADAEERAQFVRDLQKIVCSPALPGEAEVVKPLDPQAVQDLIDTFGKASGHSFTDAQRGLLQAGVEALVQINDSEASRSDLGLIKKNIGMFIGNVQQVLGIEFSSTDTRLLTRALVRLVGDGRQNDM